jgi:hypothetical protein
VVSEPRRTGCVSCRVGFSPGSLRNRFAGSVGFEMISKRTVCGKDSQGGVKVLVRGEWTEYFQQGKDADHRCNREPASLAAASAGELRRSAAWRLLLLCCCGTSRRWWHAPLLNFAGRQCTGRSSVETFDSKMDQFRNKVVLVGYGAVLRYPNKTVRIEYQFHVGRPVHLEGGPLQVAQLAIDEIAGSGFWRAVGASLECPKRAPGEEEGPCWFQWQHLHPCSGVQLVCSESGDLITPDFWGARFDGRIIKVISPNGMINKYSSHPESYLTPESIRALIDVYKLPDSRG